MARGGKNYYDGIRMDTPCSLVPMFIRVYHDKSEGSLTTTNGPAICIPFDAPSSEKIAFTPDSIRYCWYKEAGKPPAMCCIDPLWLSGGVGRGLNPARLRELQVTELDGLRATYEEDTPSCSDTDPGDSPP